MQPTVLRTQVAIIGAGPAGLLLSQILHSLGVSCTVVEKHSRAHVLSRIRAGVLEPSSTELLRHYGLAERMDREGHPHDGMRIVWAGRESFFIDVKRFLDKRFVAYGQTLLQEDLFAAADRHQTQVVSEAEDVVLHEVMSSRPAVTFTVHGEPTRLECDFVAGCDGFHGVSRRTIPSQARSELEKIYPFGWLGILCATPPLPEITYCNHPRGFALASMRSPQLSRYYIQVPLETRIEGDAAHVVPPTGAKGLNLAISDVFYLGRALGAFYREGSTGLLEAYSDTALKRVWSAVRVSWYLTMLLHRFPDATEFDQRAQEFELEYLRSSVSAQAALAEQYGGLPL